jgi:hypothetical protein
MEREEWMTLKRKRWERGDSTERNGNALMKNIRKKWTGKKKKKIMERNLLKVENSKFKRRLQIIGKRRIEEQ